MKPNGTTDLQQRDRRSALLHKCRSMAGKLPRERGSPEKERCGRSLTFGASQTLARRNERTEQPGGHDAPAIRRSWPATLTVASYYGVMTKHLTVRLDDDLAADTEALARAEGRSLNETVKEALREAIERRRKDPKFRTRIQRIIEEDRELLERLAK